MKALKQFFLVSFLAVAALGYVFFGPAEHTRVVTETEVYRMYLLPVFNRLMALTGNETEVVGQLVKAEGEVQYRASSELVYQRAQSGQRFTKRTLVSSGEKSRGVVSLIDESKIELEENSVILLDIKADQKTGLSSLTLKVVQGAATAQKSATSKMQVKIINSKGEEKALSQEKVSVIAPRKVKSVSATKAEKNISSETDEYIGPAVDNLAQLQQKLEEQKVAELNEQQILQQAKLEEEMKAKEAEQKARAEAGINDEAEALRMAGRIPASVAPLIDIPDRIPQRVRKNGLTRWTAPPVENHLSRAIYAQKIGKPREARRYMALSVTTPGYFGKDFNDATRVAVEGLISGYLQHKDCRQARDTLSNVQRRYSSSSSAQDWASRWKLKISKSTCI